MKCKNFLSDIGPAYLEKNPILNTKYAGQNVGLDLEKPIDCSQMDVYQLTCEPVYTEYTLAVKRTSILHAYVFNEEGEREELTITFELNSQKMPKLKP